MLVPTELQTFLDMLARARIGHGTRVDYNPPGTGVLVEFAGSNRGVSDWLFDDQGQLVDALLCDPE